VKLVIPRPKSTGEEVPGVGKVCILYSSLLLSSVDCLYIVLMLLFLQIKR
jgi:hypothetical protein